MATYDLGIATLVLSYERARFDRRHDFESAVRRVVRKIVARSDELLQDSRSAYRELYRELRRQPSVGEIAARMGKPVELISQVYPSDSSVDVYGQDGQTSRLSHITEDLQHHWRSIRGGGLGLIVNKRSWRSVFQSELQGLAGREAKFYFTVFANTPSEGFCRWRNFLAQNYVDGEHWPIIVLLTYSNCPGRDFRTYMREVGGDYTFLVDIEPGVHYFGPGIGFRNAASGSSGRQIGYVIGRGPTFILENVVNQDVLAERLKSMIEWIRTNAHTVFQ